MLLGGRKWLHADIEGKHLIRKTKAGALSGCTSHEVLKRECRAHHL